MKVIKPKLTKHDFKRWQENEFTKFFFEEIEKNIDDVREIIINMTMLLEDSKELYSAGGELKTLERIMNIDCLALGIVEVEDDSKQS